ncbi:hypothetical protein JW948_16765 [bacterium]|nr:hypothetical protein [bacterium]
MWAAYRIAEYSRLSSWTPVTSALTLIKIIIGVAFCIRKPLLKRGDLRSILFSLPSIILGGAAYKLAGPVSEWPDHAEILFIAGAIVSLVSFFYLGRCFAILPGVRGVVVRGPYRLLRHPAYFGEMLIITGFVFAGSWLSVCVLVCVIPGIVIRIRAEEKILAKDERYLQYQKHTKWKLLYGIW